MLKKILIVFALVVVAAAIGFVAMIGPRNLIGYIMYGGQAREGNLKVGDLAPDVALVALDGVTSRTLSEWIGPSPLVIVFGSFT
jgi:hypothetical protein